MRFLAALLLFLVPMLAAPVKKKAPAKTASRAVSKKKGKAAPAAPKRTTQQTPSPERYKEIQQALAEKGFLKSEPNGVWDAQSAEALRQFQAQNDLSVTGKLSAASLIKLGLGGAPAATP